MNSRSRISLLLVVLIAVAFALPATAADPATTKQTTQTTRPTAKPAAGATVPVPIKRVECVVQGSPVEFPDDLYIRNTGNFVFPKGWDVSWSIPGTSRKGTYKLTADLAVGSGVLASGQLPGGHPAGVKADCTCAEPQGFSPVQPKMVARPVHTPVAVPLYKLGCVVQGTPVEFPDDVNITNNGTSTVKKGKTLHWEIPNTSRKGDYVLTQDLLAGKSVFVSGALPGGHPAGAQCTVTVK